MDVWCKSCRREHRKSIRNHLKDSHMKIREDNRDYINNAKTPCLKCGESRPYVIHFHHIRPSEKEFTLGHNLTYSRERLNNEIKKCICLCANCHTEFHYLYGQSPSDPVKSLYEYVSDVEDSAY